MIDCQQWFFMFLSVIWVSTQISQILRLAYYKYTASLCKYAFIVIHEQGNLEDTLVLRLSKLGKRVVVKNAVNNTNYGLVGNVCVNEKA